MRAVENLHLCGAAGFMHVMIQRGLVRAGVAPNQVTIAVSLFAAASQRSKPRDLSATNKVSSEAN